jgi:catalase
MNGYSSHTYSWINEAGERFWVKYHFKTVQGAESFTDAEAKAMTAENPDFHRRDLRAAIDHGDCPEWRLEMQIMPLADAADYRFNPFDLTRSGRTPTTRRSRSGAWSSTVTPPTSSRRSSSQASPRPNFVPGIDLSPAW